MSEVTVRPMRFTDLEAVEAIEQKVFSTPWSLSSFREGLAAGASFSWTAEERGRVVGYLVSWVVEDELHIGNLAVAPAHQGRGIARRMVEHALGDAAGRGVTWAALEVRRSNVRAQRLYASFGFSRVGVRRRYYSDDGEDAIVMGLEVRGGAR
ncbi:MAG: ribosomal-protein-alanine N-acetyltransferase [Candidatus Eisenbacteria bacterium]|nr:ribosomal-protein-alanine N-acetyltransferase [Candidatus Eisenbacteria bacterium]